ncbi:MAG: tRNA (guanosine(37)-N1)-methyltransferase TrmD [Candidatus Yanofskybacteria bacterium]|nr:tRNA (guanosine(37)-N1)-methyltransferase TrmD [Candidatus Yanofskybacteria bacterium]
MIQFDVITIFPEIFKGFVSESLLARGQKKKIIRIGLHNLRKWTTDKHKTVDDNPYGGGPGMVLKIEPIFKAVKSIELKVKSKRSKNVKPKTYNLKQRVILFSPRGKKLTQELAKKWAKLDQLIFICGRYEGVDERVADYIADEVISIGDYVLNGGEVAAMAVIESVSRLIPGFIAKKESAQKADHAQYTRPEVFIMGKKRLKVPKVLLSGDHKKIKEWRKNII